ncbi:MAG: helix-turn-helix domain-containing protein [Candidatus Delongbacteria bacterium]|nr:helix-turn-helix domain-containing protein [Candidatus Delongbacteria bacterium]MCG2759954.1 helix-turn-helix domain-containing protein [Candidatus Delongbacteria bacterium]
MKKNSKDLYKDIDDFFAADFTPNQKAWDMIHDFYHLILTEMEKKGIRQVDLAKKLNKSPAAVSKLLNKTPNISLKKMVELADSVGLDLVITSVKKEIYKTESKMLMVAEDKAGYKKK